MSIMVKNNVSDSEIQFDRGFRTIAASNTISLHLIKISLIKSNFDVKSTRMSEYTVN